MKNHSTSGTTFLSFSSKLCFELQHDWSSLTSAGRFFQLWFQATSYRQWKKPAPKHKFTYALCDDDTFLCLARWYHFLLLPAFIHTEVRTQDVIVTSHNNGKTLTVTNNNNRLLFINLSQANFYSTVQNAKWTPFSFFSQQFFLSCL